jgi:hypothetical protein
VERRHRSREFIALLKDLDQYCPPGCTIRIVLDNHSAHPCNACPRGIAWRGCCEGVPRVFDAAVAQTEPHLKVPTFCENISPACHYFYRPTCNYACNAALSASPSSVPPFWPR